MDKRASSISGDLELKQFFSDFDQKWNATQNNSIMLHNVPDIAVLSLSPTKPGFSLFCAIPLMFNRNVTSMG